MFYIFLKVYCASESKKVKTIERYRGTSPSANNIIYLDVTRIIHDRS